MTTKQTQAETGLPTIKLGEINAADAMFLKGESDLRTRQTGHSIYLLDSIPDWDRFFAVWERASRALPPLHHRVVQPSGPGRLPIWQFDPDLDLKFHIRRLAVPSPGTLRQVFEMAENDGMVMLDSARPLWQVTLIEGLEGERAALLLKFHHLWVDGKTNIEVARLIYDIERNADLDKAMPPLPTPPSEAQTSILTKAAREARKTAGKSLSTYGDAMRFGARAATHPRQAISDGGELLASARRVLSPPAAKPSPLIAGRSFKSRYDVLDVPFTELRRAVKSVGCTINDGYLAGIAGGVRLYHERLGATVGEVPIAMPMSTGSDDGIQTGNQVTASLLAIPCDITDPIERLHRVHEIVKSVRQEPAAEILTGITRLLVLVPEQLIAGALSGLMNLMDFGVSQVPGMMEPRYIAGAQLTHYYGFGPRTGMAAFIGMMTHLDNCCIGVHSDPAAIADPDLFIECLSQSFNDILAIGRQSQGAGRKPARKTKAKAKTKSRRRSTTASKAARKPR